jgi:hypothetical protein
MPYKFKNPHDWLDFAVKNNEINIYYLLELIHKSVSSDDIQDMFTDYMDKDGYSDEEGSQG